MTLTQQHIECLEFIRGYIQANGISPSLGEIAEAMGRKSRSRAHYIVRALVDAGRLRHTPDQHRSLQLVDLTLPDLASRSTAEIRDLKVRCEAILAVRSAPADRRQPERVSA